MNRNDKEFMVQKIRSEYTQREPRRLEELKALDKKVKRPANVFAYVFGSIGAVIMGSGMSLVMTDIGAKLGMGNVMFPGIITGIIGMALVSCAYPVYEWTLKRERKRIAPEILRQSDELLK